MEEWLSAQSLFTKMKMVSKGFGGDFQLVVQEQYLRTHLCL